MRRDRTRSRVRHEAFWEDAAASEDAERLNQVLGLLRVRRIQAEVEVLAARRVLQLAQDSVEALRRALSEQATRTRQTRDDRLAQHLSAPLDPRTLIGWRKSELAAIDALDRQRRQVAQEQERAREASEELARQLARRRLIDLRQEKFSTAVDDVLSLRQ